MTNLSEKTSSGIDFTTRAEHNGSSLSSFRQSLMFWPFVVLLCSLTVTVFTWQKTRETSERELRGIFEHQVAEILGHLTTELAKHELLLKGVNGLFNATGYVARSDFRRYYESLQLDEKLSVLICT